MPRTSVTGARPTTLPYLGEPSRRQRVLWGVAVAGALVLLVAVTLRLITHIALLQWWVPFALLAGVALADFLSGLLHWAADTWGRADLPVIGRRVLVPFRVHHINPDDFLRRSFLDTNGDVAALAIPLLLAVVWMPMDALANQAFAVAGFGFCAMGAMTNQIHQWAHMPTPPRGIAILQAAGLLLRPAVHVNHHGRPYDGTYCITTGWCNRPLDAIAFFRRLECAITRLTGAMPRSDEQQAPATPQTAHHDDVRHA